MSDQTLTKIFIGMVALGAGLLLYSQRDRFSSGSQPQYDESAQEQIERIKKMSAEINEVQRDQSEEVKPVQVKKEELVLPTHEEKLQIQSENAKKDFATEIRVQMELPPELTFIPIDIDEQAMAIYGYNHEMGVGLTALAVAKDVKDEEVLPYLDQNQGYLENTKNNPVATIGKPTKLPKPKESTNLKDATLWSGKLQNGDDAHIVMLRRADSKGSYFFLYSGPNDYFSENEDYFDSLLDNFKALPGEASKQ